jgi:hypothetical protein
MDCSRSAAANHWRIFVLARGVFAGQSLLGFALAENHDFDRIPAVEFIPEGNDLSIDRAPTQWFHIGVDAVGEVEGSPRSETVSRLPWG